MPGAGLEPARRWAADFKSALSADSSTPASGYTIILAERGGIVPDQLHDALASLAKHLYGRHDFEGAVAVQTAERLKALVDRVRQLEESALREVAPAFAYHVGHAAFASPARSALDTLRSLNLPPGHSTGATNITSQRGDDFLAPVAARRPAVMADDELGRMTLLEQAQAVRSREVSAVELTRRCLEQAERLGAQLHAFVTLTAEAALAKAAAIDKALAVGDTTGILAGVPVAFKDLHYVTGVPTTAGSKIFENFYPDYDGTVVQKLTEAGVVCIGKTNTHQFAFGATSESSDAGVMRNPWNTGHSPGGSSGGSGAAVAARIVACATGTDTGGSIRIPAAACGVFGIKPTYGRVSKAGLVPLSWSLDHVGPLAVSVADAAVVLSIMAGEDPADPSTVPVPVPDYLAAVRSGQQQGIPGMRVGIVTGWLNRRVHPAVVEAVHDAAGVLAAAGAEVVEVELPDAEMMAFANRLIILAEAAAYHAPLLARYADRYAPDVRARLELGQFIPSRDYILGHRLRAELARLVNQRLQAVDVILTPALPMPAPATGAAQVEWEDGAEATADALIRFTAPFNVTGHPAASIPIGFAQNGLPVAVQLVGRPFREEDIFRAAAVLEQDRPFRSP